MISHPKSQVDCQVEAGSSQHKFFLNALAKQELVIKNPRMVEVRVLFDNGAFFCIEGPCKVEPSENAAPERSAIYRKDILDGVCLHASL